MYVLKCMNVSLLLEIAESGQFEPAARTLPHRTRKDGAPSGSVPGLRPLMEVWARYAKSVTISAATREASE
jgi:hypothetical protein